MSVRVIEVPYDSGHYGARMGAGPLRLSEGGLVGRLKGAGFSVDRSRLEVDLGFPTENAMAFEVARRLSGRVRAAAREDAFPLILAGNCASCLGTVAGLDAEPVGVVWLDAHGDFNTPETTASGFLDGMALSMLVGDCWTTACGSIEGFSPLPEEAVLLVGARDLDRRERERLDRSAVRRLGLGDLEDDATVEAALDSIARRATAIYLHLDLDVLDPDVARANSYGVPGGLSVDQVEVLVQRIATAAPIAAAAITAYAPEVDSDGRAGAAAESIIRRLLEVR